jgi:hypothetical protein
LTIPVTSISHISSSIVVARMVSDSLVLQVRPVSIVC